MADEPDYVPLKDVLKRVQMQRSVAVEAAQDIIRRAHQIGDLELKIRHPGGSFGDLRADVWRVDPHHGETWRMLFDEGVIGVEVHQGRRRVGPFETCRIFGICNNLDSFLGAETSGAAPIRPREGGRPSDRDRVIIEAKRRIAAREPLPASLAAFANELQRWLDKQPDAIRTQKTRKVMATQTIETHVRPLWSAHRA